MRILLIEDDDTLGRAIHMHLDDRSYGVDWVRRLSDADEALTTVNYEMVLLDLGLPEGEGLSFLKALRMRNEDTPIIVTTAKQQVECRIECLNSGADDCIAKPFSFEELDARVAAVMRRSMRHSSSLLEFGDVEMDMSRRHMSRGGVSVTLTSREWAVLECLVRNRGSVVSKANIEDSLYAFGAEIGSNAVEVFVSRLRKKLGNDAIKTVRYSGYQFGWSN
jgi:two-component system OmpR family response regulator